MERQEGGIVSQNFKKAGHFKQEEMSAVLDSGKSRGMGTRTRSLALVGSVERICDFYKEYFSNMIEKVARVQRG